jgi:hypothetical protein
MSESMFIQAVSLARSGRKVEARRLLEQILKADRTNEMAWLWYAECVETPAERARALEACMRINPQAQRARLSLSALQQTGQLANDDGLTIPVFIGEEEEHPARPDRVLSNADQWVLSPESGVFTVSPEHITAEEFDRVEARTEAFLLKNPDLKPIWIREHNGSARCEAPHPPPDSQPVPEPAAAQVEPASAAKKTQRKSRGAVYTLLLITLMFALLASAVILLQVV